MKFMLNLKARAGRYVCPGNPLLHREASFFISVFCKGLLKIQIIIFYLDIEKLKS